MSEQTLITALLVIIVALLLDDRLRVWIGMHRAKVAKIHQRKFTADCLRERHGNNAAEQYLK